MSCNKCGCGRKCSGLCPVSFGLAVGITVALIAFFWSLWVMKYGMPAMMANMQMAIPTLTDCFINALWGLLKGFIFGFVVAGLYSFFTCMCKSRCCNRPDAACSCCGPKSTTPMV